MMTLGDFLFGGLGKVVSDWKLGTAMLKRAKKLEETKLIRELDPRFNIQKRIK